MRPWLLDLFCGAGGASMGYYLAGFEVVGVDCRPQPNYPFAFVQDDALGYLAPELRFSHGAPFAAIHASPPCQAHSRAQRIRARTHPDAIEATRALLRCSGLPYVIENVPGAPLLEPVVLEGQMFDGLRTQRARWFETNWPLEVDFLRAPRAAPLARMGRPVKAGEWVHVVGNFSDTQAASDAMGIEWMSRDELAQAIPPAYTEFIGRRLLEVLG